MTNCKICGKDITDKAKYSKLGSEDWWCEKCFFKSDLNLPANINESKSSLNRERGFKFV